MHWIDTEKSQELCPKRYSEVQCFDLIYDTRICSFPQIAFAAQDDMINWYDKISVSFLY